MTETPEQTPIHRDRFYQGIRGRDHAAVRALLEANPGLVHTFDPDHFEANPVTVAVHHGDLQMVDLLLEFGADIDRKSDWWAGGFAPIHSIPRHMRDWMLPALLERGASWDIHAAADFGRLELVEALLDEDPDRINEPGGDGRPPLAWADTVEVAEYLLGRGADLEQRCVDHNSTPAQWAAPDRPEVCRYLIERGAETDVWMLTAAGLVDEVAALLDQDPQLLHAKLTEGFQRGPNDVAHIYHFTLGTNATLLHVAAVRGQTRVAALLFDRGADPNFPGAYDDCTPLHLAAWEDDREMVEFLLDHGADIDRPSGSLHEMEALGWAVAAGRPGIVSLLLERGATVAARHRDNVRAGLAGEFRAWTSATHDDYRRIAEILPP